MANPTTNFGWVMPTSSSLVTNLPADFNTFGQAVDTSMSELLGGTTGQVLSKTSNTNMDFTWVTPTDQTPLTTKGDLFTFTTVDARLAVGNNGETLVADSAATTGLRYSATPSASNPIINSAMQVWQRGTSISLSASSGAIFTADRWTFATNASQASTVSRQVTGDTTNLPNIQYCARVQRNSGQTGTGTLHFVQSFESVNSIPFAGKTVTMSFYARKGANYSPTSNALIVYLMGGTGTDQNRGSGSSYTGETYIVNNQTATLTATWQRFTYTGTVGATVTEMAPYFDIVPTGTAGADDYFEITGVQIDIGSVALPFRTYAATIQGELAACQRYYYLHVSNTNQTFANGANFSASQMSAFINFPVTLRTTPTLVATSGTDYYSFSRNGGSDTFNSLTINTPATSGSEVYNASEISGTAGQAGVIKTNNASASVAFSAEL